MTLIKNGDVKTLSNESLVEQLLDNGWTELKEVKEVKNVKSGKPTAK